MAFDLVEGDTQPSLEVTTTPVPVGIGTSTAVLRTQQPDGTSVELELTLTDEDAGSWAHDWIAGETDMVGVHLAQVEVMLLSGARLTFPSDGTFVRWRINERLP